MKPARPAQVIKDIDQIPIYRLSYKYGVQLNSFPVSWHHTGLNSRI